MLFCEDCRIKKQWPRSAGFPFTGTKPNAKCEVCGKSGDCHDIPASKLTSEADKTVTEKLVDKAMQNGYHEKADALIIVNVSGSEAGKLNHRLTELLRKMVVERNSEIDWYETYKLRLAAQQGVQKDEESKRDRRQYGL
jgi:hypothetical protein